MAATKRKQQTVQFLFEASPENNITRCVISKTSNIFGNNEEGDSDDDRFAQITTDKVNDRKESRLINTYRNNDELNSFTQDMSSRRGLNVDKESDGDYMKTEVQTHQSHTDKVIRLREFSNSFSCENKSLQAFILTFLTFIVLFIILRAITYRSRLQGHDHHSEISNLKFNIILHV
jgi:hypothetical protein